MFQKTAYVISLVWRACPKKLVWQSLISLLQALESFIFSILFIKYIVQVLEGSGTIYQVAVFSIAALLLKLVIAILNSYYTVKLKPLFDLQVSKYLQTMLFDKALSLDLAQYESKDFQGKYYKAVSNAEGTVENTVSNCIQLFSNMIAVISVLVYVITIDPVLMIMMLIPVTTTFALKISNKLRYKLNMENLESKRKMDYVNRVLYLKEYALELRLSNIFECLKDYYVKASGEIRLNYKTYGLRLSLLRTATDFVLTTFNLLFSYLYVGWRYIFVRNILLSDFAVLVSAINNLNGKVSNLINNIYALQDNWLYISNIEDFLSEKPMISKNQSESIISTDKEMQISFDRVSFRYNFSDFNVLSNINFTIRKNEKIAIVGRNGSGKSTLIKLLMRLYDATEGEISINGTNIKTINLEGYRNLFAPVFQDYKLFATSIEDNILLGNNTPSAIDSALKYTGLYEKITSFENGPKTQLTKEFDCRGVVLSGGQNQKLALSRAFASKAPIIILDEPTASLDPEAEHLIYKNIYEKMRDKTVIFVSHRLTSTIMADKIIMMESGRMSESGTHNDLMKQKGSYYKLFQIQAESYREAE